MICDTNCSYDLIFVSKNLSITDAKIDAGIPNMENSIISNNITKISFMDLTESIIPDAARII